MPGGAAWEAPGGTIPAASPTPYGFPGYPGIGDYPPAAQKTPRKPAQEIWIALLIIVGCAVLGMGMAFAWAWLAPKVPLIAQGKQILYVDPEGEQRAGADSVFALLALGLGLFTALGAFLLTRKRGGGITVAVGLAFGGLLGSAIAWRLGMRLGPTSDVVAHAKQVGSGKAFEESLELSAHGALLVWPIAAMVLLLALSAAFGKREEDPPPYWAGPQWPDPEQTGVLGEGAGHAALPEAVPVLPPKDASSPQ